MTTIALVKDDRYLRHEPGEGHPESPDRLRTIHHLLDNEYNDLPCIPPRPATPDELALIHDPFYIHDLEQTRGAPFTRLDADTALSPHSYDTALLAAGGLLQAVDAVLSPEPSTPRPDSVFACIRPPGHHAEPSRGMGFCLFNNVAIAAEYAKQRHGMKRILIVDWDLHHGNGTQLAFYHDPSVFYFSSHQFPHYPGTGDFEETGAGEGEGFTVNVPLPSGFGDAEYSRIYEAILKPIALEYQPELVLVSAGFDACFDDPLGGMAMTANGFGHLARIVHEIAAETCGGKMILALEGGYRLESLQKSVRSVLNALLGKPFEPIRQDPLPETRQIIARVKQVQGKYGKYLQ